MRRRVGPASLTPPPGSGHIARRRMRRTSMTLGVGGLVATLLICPTASAQNDTWNGGFNEKPAQRRSDFAAGFGGGLMLGDARGYPNQVEKLGNPADYASTGFGAGGGGSLWIGGALKDWFSVGIGTVGGSFSANNLKASGGAFVLHIETFPLFYQGGVWRDVGLFADFGAGGLTVTRGSSTAADGGSMAMVGFGALWEAWHFGHFASGPMLEYERLFSPSLTVDGALVGMRIVYYGGP